MIAKLKNFAQTAFVAARTGHTSGTDKASQVSGKATPASADGDTTQAQKARFVTVAALCVPKAPKAVPAKPAQVTATGFYPLAPTVCLALQAK